MNATASLIDVLGALVYVAGVLIVALFWFALVGGVVGSVVEVVLELFGAGKRSAKENLAVKPLPTEEEIRALGFGGDEEAVRSLVNLIENDDSPRVGEALEALGNIADESAALALIELARKDAQAWASDFGNYLGDYSGRLEAAARASAADNPTPYIEALSDEDVGSWAAEVLADVDDPDTVRPIIEIAIADPRARENAVDALGYLPNATRRVLAALRRSDLDADIRSRFSSLMLDGSGPVVNRFARLAVHDPSAKVRRKAVDYVARHIADEDMEDGFDLLEAALADEDPWVSFSAAGHLARLCGTGHPLVSAWVLSALSDPDPFVQERGIRALSGETDARLVRPVFMFLRTPSEAAMVSTDYGTTWTWPRRAARRALGRLDAAGRVELAAARASCGTFSVADSQYANAALASSHPSPLLLRLDAGWLGWAADVAAAAIDAMRLMENGGTATDAIESTDLRELIAALSSTYGPASLDLPADPVTPDDPDARDWGRAAGPEPAAEDSAPGLAEVRLLLQRIDDDNAAYIDWLQKPLDGLAGAMGRSFRDKARAGMATEFDEKVPRALVRLIAETAEAATSWARMQENDDSENRAAEDALLECVESLCAALGLGTQGQSSEPFQATNRF